LEGIELEQVSSQEKVERRMTVTLNQTRKISLQITGMTCAGCAATVEKALTDVGGVSHANVNLASEKANIEYDPTETDQKELVKAVWSTGYGVVTERAIFRVGAITCASCAGTIGTALNELPGVVSVNVNLASEKATVQFLPGEATTSDFKKAVEGAGYQFLGDGEVQAGKITFAVTGMTCASCVSHVERALRQVDGVISANANLAGERAAVEYDVARVSIDSLRKAVEDAGYGMGAMVSEETPVPDALAESSRREVRTLRDKLIFAGVIGAYMLLVAVSEFTGRWLPSIFSNKYLLWVVATAGAILGWLAVL
jgi:Cu+-exporting ATPase